VINIGLTRPQDYIRTICKLYLPRSLRTPTDESRRSAARPLAISSNLLGRFAASALLASSITISQTTLPAQTPVLFTIDAPLASGTADAGSGLAATSASRTINAHVVDVALEDLPPAVEHADVGSQHRYRRPNNALEHAANVLSALGGEVEPTELQSAAVRRAFNAKSRLVRLRQADGD
jgi:hypothetical protein